MHRLAGAAGTFGYARDRRGGDRARRPASPRASGRCRRCGADWSAALEQALGKPKSQPEVSFRSGRYQLRSRLLAVGVGGGAGACCRSVSLKTHGASGDDFVRQAIAAVPALRPAGAAWEDHIWTILTISAEASAAAQCCWALPASPVRPCCRACRPGRCADYPALGTFPAGQSGDSVFVGIDMPLTGTYAAAGADEQKGIELAIEHLNNGDDLIKAISTKTTKGVLGKTVTSAAADEAAKADHRRAERHQVRPGQQGVGADRLGVVAAPPSRSTTSRRTRRSSTCRAFPARNDTTGKDCTRYSFRACFYAYIGVGGASPRCCSTSSARPARPPT